MRLLFLGLFYFIIPCVSAQYVEDFSDGNFTVTTPMRVKGKVTITKILSILSGNRLNKKKKKAKKEQSHKLII